MLLRQLYTQQPTQQQLADYANAVLNVNSYAYAITNQKLPVLLSPPSEYADFATSFTPAKQHALNWTINIFVNMIQLPVTIKEQAAGLFDMDATLIEINLNNLIANPNDTKSKTALAKALGQLQTVIQDQVSTITSIQTSLTKFSQDIYDDAKTLTYIAQRALADVKTDQDTLVDIQTDITNLNAEIKTAQILMAVSEMAIGITIFVAIIGAAVCLLTEGGAPMGAIGVVAVAVAGTAASIAGTVVESLRIKSMQSEIESDQKQIDGLNQDIILLQAVSAQFNALYDANMKAQTALTVIQSMWTNLDTTIEGIKTELTEIGTDTTGAQYQEALDAFQKAETNWNEVVAFATALANIEYNWQDTDGNWHNYTAQSPRSADQGYVTQIPSQIGKAA